MRTAVICALTLGAPFAPAAAFGAADVHFHVGNAAEYPDLAGASLANQAKAHRLQLRTNNAAARFGTIGAGLRLGYRFRYEETRCPGFVHMRKNRTKFWGRVLNPNAPQALLWWCSSSARWTLAAFMYRAPGDRFPPLYGGLLGWHRHAFSPTSTWMTHVWLTGDTRSSLATCAPFNTLVERLGLVYEPYGLGIPADRPCTDSVGSRPTQ